MTDKTLKQIQQDFKAAQYAYEDFKGEVARERREAEYAAAAIVNEKHAEKVNSLHKTYWALKDSLRLAKDAAASHPWEGKEVTSMQRTHRYYKEERVKALVEVVRSDTEFTLNIASYSKPSVGEVIVRKLKKDGTPSLKFWDSYYSDSKRLAEQWTLVEEFEKALYA